MKNLILFLVASFIFVSVGHSQTPPTSGTVPGSGKKPEKSAEKKEKAKKRKKDFTKECRQSSEVVSAMKACVQSKKDVWKTERAAKKKAKAATSTPVSGEPATDAPTE